MTSNYQPSVAEIAFIRGVRNAVEQRGRDFVYPKGEEAVAGGWRLVPEGACLNKKIVPNSAPSYADAVTTGEGACIVGLGAVLAGLEIDTFGGATTTLPELFGLHWSEHNPVISAAGTAQSLQDQGENWGVALDKFEAELAAAGIIVD